VEERLALLYNLKRKYGGSIAEVLAYRDQAQAELERITHSEERTEWLRAEEERLRREIGQAALALSQARRAAGERLAAEAEAQLNDLNMRGARFAVALSWSDDPSGVYVGERTLACNENGIDRVEFLIAPNPGEGLNPLSKTASGGEASRLMLALKTVLAAADETPTLIFDELDQGIGGRIGAVVGRKLRQISHSGLQVRQVICVTHLPQIAGYADVHFVVEKGTQGGPHDDAGTRCGGRRAHRGAGCYAGHAQRRHTPQRPGNPGRSSAECVVERIRIFSHPHRFW
jgi:DNA repair protein RecN (Recombination protein N)